VRLAARPRAARGLMRAPIEPMRAPTDTAAPKTPNAVLFICSMNAIRSPIAEALTKYLFPRRIFAQSVGVRPGEPDGFAIAAMEEMGLDLSGHVPRSHDDLEDMSYDLIVTLAPEAHHKALEWTRALAVDVEYWPTEDPSLVLGNREQKLDAYRRVRDSLMTRIKTRFGWSPIQGG